MGREFERSLPDFVGGGESRGRLAKFWGYDESGPGCCPITEPFAFGADEDATDELWLLFFEGPPNDDISERTRK